MSVGVILAQVLYGSHVDETSCALLSIYCVSQGSLPLKSGSPICPLFSLFSHLFFMGLSGRACPNTLDPAHSPSGLHKVNLESESSSLSILHLSHGIGHLPWWLLRHKSLLMLLTSQQWRWSAREPKGSAWVTEMVGSSFKKILLRGVVVAERAWLSKTSAAILGDLSLGHSSHTGCVTTTCNPNFRRSNALFWPL